MSNLARISDHDRYDPRELPEEPRRSIQVEDGYTRIANPIMDALCCADFNAREFRVVNFVIRETYGWQVKQKRMSGEYIATKVKLDPSRCSKVLNELIRREVLIRHGGSRSPVSLNKNVDDWKPRVGSNRQPPTRCADSAQHEPTQSAQDEPTYKDRKDNLEPKGSKKSSKKSPPKKWGEEIDHELADLMFARTTEDLTNPKRPNMNAWANDIRLMRTKDQRTVEQIRYLINWVADDSFWSSNVMCPSKLREKWDALEKKVRAYKEARHANRQGFDQQRENRDRVAAMLADPNDTSWADGLFDEEGDGSGAGEPGLHATGGDFSQDVENGFHRPEHGQARQAGADYLDGEVVDTADDSRAGHGTRADQGRGRRVAAERGEAGQDAAAEAGGFWNA